MDPQGRSNVEQMWNTDDVLSLTPSSDLRIREGKQRLAEVYESGALTN